MKLPLPTTIVTGALGVGKTTAIGQLLARRPKGEKWAVLVNEFGALGIDGALLEAAGSDEPDEQVDMAMEGVTVKQLAGGCMCCVAAGMLTPAVAMLVRQAKPDRLLIEPSGLGHPAGLLDILQGEHLRSAIQIQMIVCLVDPTEAPSLTGLYLDQVNISDIVVATKADLASPESISQFHTWAAGLYPPKAEVHVVERGRLDLSVLTSVRTVLLPPTFESLHKRPEATSHQEHAHDHHTHHDHNDHHHHHHHHHDAPASQPEEAHPTPGCPVRFEASGDAGQAVGWVFAREDLFKRDALLAFFECLWPQTARIKGVFRTGDKTWVQPVLERSGADSGGCQQLQLSEVAYRKDSRIEIIMSSGRDGPGGSMDSDSTLVLQEALQGLPLAGGKTVTEGLLAAVTQRDWETLEKALLHLLQ